MPNINDFKLIAKKSDRYADLLFNVLDRDLSIQNEKQKERIGFYLYILENICGIRDIPDLVGLITDTDFNSLVFGRERIDDCGIDAVQIDDEFTVNLFNFKYREKFDYNNQQSTNEPFVSAKFINALTTENTNNLKGEIKENAASIIKRLNSSDEWKLKLYIVSNEIIELKKTDENLKRLEENYGLEIIPIGLPQICQYMSIRPEAIDAELTVDNDAVMSFSEDTISSSKSYIVRLPVNEVIRITCNDKVLRNQYNLEDVSNLENVSLDYSVLFDNVRGFVLRSKYNTNISATLEQESSKFFMYNNGLT